MSNEPVKPQEWTYDLYERRFRYNGEHQHINKILAALNRTAPAQEWRMLEVGEVIREGDETSSDNKHWFPVGERIWGHEWKSPDFWSVRRCVLADTPARETNLTKGGDEPCALKPSAPADTATGASLAPSTDEKSASNAATDTVPPASASGQPATEESSKPWKPERFRIELIEAKSKLARCERDLTALQSVADQGRAEAEKLTKEREEDRYEAIDSRMSFAKLLGIKECFTPDIEDAIRTLRADNADLAERLSKVTGERDEWRCSAKLYHSELRDLAEGKKVETQLGFPVEKKIRDLQAQIATAQHDLEALRPSLDTALARVATLTAELRKVKTTAEEIRLILIHNLAEPERSAFWKAVELKRSVAAALEDKQ